MGMLRAIPASHMLFETVFRFIAYGFHEWRESRYGINYVLDFISLSILMKTMIKILSTE